MIYRVEFKKTLKPEAAPKANDPARRRQRAAVADHRRHRNDEGHADRTAAPRPRRTMTTTDTGAMTAITTIGRKLCWDAICRSCPTTTARKPTGSSTARPIRRLRFGRCDEPRSRPLQSAVRRYLHPHAATAAKDHRRAVRRSLPARREGHLRPGQPEPQRSRRHPGRPSPAGRGRVHRVQCLLDRPRGADHGHLPERHPAQRPASPELDRQPAARPFEHQPPATQTVDPDNIITGLRGSGAIRAGRAQRACRCSMPVWWGRSVTRSTCAAAR